MAILTISRETGSGGTEIGRAIADVMGYEYVDKEAVLSDLREAGARWERWAKELDEHCPTVWERYDWSFRGFAALVQSRMLDHAARGRVVIMGRGGNFLLQGIASALRIRVVAPLDLRIGRLAAEEKTDRQTARWLVEKADAERSCFVYSVYGKRWDDPSGYDAVFRLESQGIGDVVRGVQASLTERDREDTEGVRKAIRHRAAAAKVKAGIATNPAFFVPVLDVLAEGEGLVLRGVAHSPREHRRIEDEARRLAGPLPLRCELHYRGFRRN